MLWQALITYHKISNCSPGFNACKYPVENGIHFIVECTLYAALPEKYNIVSFSESNYIFFPMLRSHFLTVRVHKLHCMVEV